MAKGKHLVIVESPAKAKTINKILGSKDYVVRASFGHVRDLPKSKIGVDIDDGFKPTYVQVEKKGDAIAELRSLAKSGGDVYLCPDPDREGEAIAWHLFEMLGLKKSNSHRVTFNEITPKAIKEAFQNPRDIDMNLVNSQQARRFLDRIVGYKLSPILWTKILRGLSAGRVQSVTTRLLAEREAEIRAFRADEYWTCSCDFCELGILPDEQKKAKLPCHAGDDLRRHFFRADLKERDGKKIVSSADEMEKAKAKPDSYEILNKKESEGLVEALMYMHWEHKVSKHETKETKQHAIPPFSTSYLQQAAANRLGFDTKRTMGIAQRLYEGVNMDQGPVGLITYMRTDSFSISKDAQAEARDFIRSEFGDEYYPEKPNYYKGKKGAQEAHECIRPTHVDITPAMAKPRLQNDEFRLYELIWNRFVASQMAPGVFDSTTCEISSVLPKKYVVDGKEYETPYDGVEHTLAFRATGRVMKFDGWLRVYDRDDDDDVKLPPIRENDDLVVQKVDGDEHFTQPPPRYNEASLVKTMEQEGIGRPSTYSSIISLIQDRGYARKIGKGGKAPLEATDLGMIVTQSLVGQFPSIMDVGFTREMEDKLDEVEEGKINYVALLEEFYKGFSKEMERAKKEMPSTKDGWESDLRCPKCDGPTRRRLSKFGFFVACQDQKCKTMADIGPDGKPKAKPEAEPTGIRCDDCGGDVYYATGRFGAYLHCQSYKDKEKKCVFTMAINKAGEPHRKFKAIPTEVECERCHKQKMVIRVSARGKKNKPFLSCPGFPKCRAATDLPPEMAALGEQAMASFHEGRRKDAADLCAFRSFMEGMSPGVE